MKERCATEWLLLTVRMSGESSASRMSWRDARKLLPPSDHANGRQAGQELFDREGWLFELKWDGFRAIAEKDKQGVRLYSRNQNDFKKRFPVIIDSIN